MALNFLIDKSDEKFAITDGGCVDDCIATLNSDCVKLHYHTSMIDFSVLSTSSFKLVLKPNNDVEMFEAAKCVMCGDVMELRAPRNRGKDGKDGTKDKVLLISFGGLIGEFRVGDNQLQSYGLNELNLPNKMYLYIL